MTITGVRSRLASHAFVYLPPQYFQAAYRRRAFPAAEVFTGFPGTDLNLLKGLNFPRRLLGEIQTRRARPTVLVMMRPSVNFPRDTECTDVPQGTAGAVVLRTRRPARDRGNQPGPDPGVGRDR